jgi:glycosyltransferase involved in cell wall biosynthesis
VPHVVVVLQDEVLGGSTIALLRMLPYLEDRGWEVSFWCSQPSPLFDDLAAEGRAVAGAPRLMKYRLQSLRHPPGVRTRLASFPRSLAALRRHLREVRPDLVHANGRRAVPEALVARASGFRVVGHMHDGAVPGVRGLLGRLAPWLAAHEVVVVSESHADLHRLGRREPRVVPGSAVRPKQAHWPDRSPGAAPVVGTIGWVSERKGTDVFVDMAEHLRDAGVDADLRIVGRVEDGPEKPWALEQLARGERAGVRHLGELDVSEELPGWDVMVLASRQEPFGLVVTEAMSFGVAVVGSDVDGIADQLRDGAGILVPVGDGAALARAVAGLVRDPQRRAQLGGAGHRRYLERYTPERAADALETVWNDALRHE